MVKLAYLSIPKGPDKLQSDTFSKVFADTDMNRYDEKSAEPILFPDIIGTSLYNMTCMLVREHAWHSDSKRYA